jgi:ribokinase
VQVDLHMTRILVAGHINIETTLRVDAFPIPYRPANYPFFGIGTTVSGVGYNVSKALTVLGNQVDFHSLIGSDSAGLLVREALAAIPLDDSGVLAQLPQSCQSVILYDSNGRRQIYTDLKDVQEQRYPETLFAQALVQADGCVLCNINYARPMLDAARAAGKPIATDVHALADLEDAYNADFMQAADVLFMSHERLPEPPDVWARAVMARYDPQVLVIGMGAEGALLAERATGVQTHLPAAALRPVVSTIGAGDALFACFVDGYWRGMAARTALARAMRFAAWKIGVASASEGYLSRGELDAGDTSTRTTL